MIVRISSFFVICVRKTQCPGKRILLDNIVYSG